MVIFLSTHHTTTMCNHDQFDLLHIVIFLIFRSTFYAPSSLQTATVLGCLLHSTLSTLFTLCTDVVILIANLRIATGCLFDLYWVS